MLSNAKNANHILSTNLQYVDHIKCIDRATPRIGLKHRRFLELPWPTAGS